MDPQMTFNGPLQGQSVVAGMTVSGGTANVHFHYAADDFRSAPLRVLPFSRNEDIVGRPGILSQLSQLLPISEARSAALYGLGGYGKTQLALEFAYLRAGDDETCAIFWVHADTEAAFAQDYALIARKGGLSVSDGEELLIAVRLFIEAQRRWLLVLDNADDLRLFGVGATTCTYPSSQAPSKSLNQYLPKSPTGSILWTSRDSRIAGSLVGPMRAIRITNMLPLEAQVLFATAKGSPLRDDELDDAVALLAELHYIPLPVSQAAAYIRRTAIPIKGYLSRLKDGNKRWFLLKRTDFDRHRREGITNSILETWNITIKHLRHESEAAVEILQTLAYIDNQNISGDIVRAAAATAAADADASVVAVGVFQGDEQKLWWADNENLEHTHSTSDAIDDSDEDVDKTAEGSAGGDDDAIADAVTRLRELSFLHMTIRSDGEPVYDMHQLVQEAMLYSHSVESDSRAQTRYIRRAIRILTMLFPDRSQENWEECETLVPHVLRVGKWAEKARQDLQVSSLLGQVSDYLYDRGRWTEKETVDQIACSLRRNFHDKRHPDTGRSLSKLAVSCHKQRVHEAAKTHTQALEIRRETMGKRHPDTEWSMAELTETHCAEGRFSDGGKASLEVVDLRQ